MISIVVYYHNEAFIYQELLMKLFSHLPLIFCSSCNKNKPFCLFCDVFDNVWHLNNGKWRKRARVSKSGNLTPESVRKPRSGPWVHSKYLHTMSHLCVRWCQAEEGDTTAQMISAVSHNVTGICVDFIVFLTVQNHFSIDFSFLYFMPHNTCEP